LLSPSHTCSFLAFLEVLAASSNQTSPSGGNETALLTSWRVTPGSGGVTNMLMVTTTMRMFDGVHSDTSHSGPILPLGLGLEVGGVSLKKGLIAPLSTGDHTDHGSAATHNGLPDAGWESNARLLSIFGVTDHDAGGSGSAGNSATVSHFRLNAGDDGAFGHLVDREDIADLQGGFVTAVNEHAGVHSFDGDEVFSA